MKTNESSWFDANRLSLGVLFTLVMASSAVQAQFCQPESIVASTPDSQLINNGDGTVSDSKTRLMWKQCAEGQLSFDCATGSAEQFTWQKALQHAQELNSNGGFAGFTDWRLPNIKELNSLVEHQCTFPAINLMRFSNTSGDDQYWSSSVVMDWGLIWIVTFNIGATRTSINDDHLQLRLVRSISSGPSIELITDGGGIRTEPSDVDTTPKGVPIQPVSSEPLPAQGSTTVSGSVGTDGLPVNPVIGNFD